MPSQSIHGLAIAKQASEGTAATTAAFQTPVNAGTINPVRTNAPLEETGPDRLRSIMYAQDAGVGGQPTIYPRPRLLALLLYLTLGAKSSDATDTDAVIHTLTLANTQPYFTAWRMLGDLLYERFVDNKIRQLVLTSEAGRPLSAQWTVEGKAPESITEAAYDTAVGAAPLENGRPFYHYDGEGAFEVDGAPVATIRRVVITINNNSSRWQGDALLAEDVTEGRLDITIETQQRITDVALWNTYHYGDPTPTLGARPSPEVVELAGGIDFKWTAVDATPGPERSAQITAPRLQIASLGGYEPSSTSNDPLVATVTYGVLSPDSGSGLTAVVLNEDDTI
jgi:hypothetical protein